MSKITRTQNLGVSRWRNPKLATIGPESLTYTFPCHMVASFGLRNRDIQDFSACVMSDADGVPVCNLVDTVDWLLIHSCTHMIEGENPKIDILGSKV